MILFLRLMKAVLLARFRRRLGPLGQSRITMRVWPNDLDLNMHANSGRFVSFTDVARIELLARMRLFLRVIRLKWRPLAGGVMITYRKSLGPFEKFTIASRVLCWDDKWFYFEHVVSKANGDVAATATTRLLMRGPDGNIPPRALVEMGAAEDVESPPVPQFIRSWREAEARA